MRHFYRSLLIVGVLVLVSSAAVAQTPRRTPKPLATPLGTLSGADIISRAGDFDDPEVSPIPKATPKTSTTNRRLRELNDRMDKLEARKKLDADEKQRRMLLNLDILTRAEQRSESLRKQLFEMIEKENSTRLRLDQIDTATRPEVIERAVQIAGTLRPEEVRESRRKSLDAERTNLEALLVQVQSTRASITASLEKADFMVEKLRNKLEKEIDDTFLNDDKPEERPDDN